MADVKHTQGPWTHNGQGDITGIENDPENDCIGPVDVCCVYLRTVEGRSEANASLIAAAPDLLEALRAFVSPWDGDSVEEIESQSGLATSVRIEQARAAIAKATGAARATEGGV